jgi:hypothetical protein
MFNNIYVENVLSDKSIQEIKDTVDHYFNSLEVTEEEFDKNITYPVKIWRKSMGRVTIQNVPLSDECLNEFKKILIDNNWDDYYYAGNTTYIEYSNKYGIPKLVPHKDGDGFEAIVVDYCIETNIVWPVVVEDKSFVLKKNSAVLFDGVNQYHSRPFIKMSDLDFEKVLLVKFTKKEKN